MIITGVFFYTFEIFCTHQLIIGSLISKILFRDETLTEGEGSILKELKDCASYILRSFRTAAYIQLFCLPK